MVLPGRPPARGAPVSGGFAVLTLALGLAAPAGAVPLSAPFGDADYGHFYPTAYYDHSGVDWACGGIRYSGHRGSDFGVGSWAGMDAGRDVVAAADGTVETTNDGEYDRCSSGACSGGSGYGNYVKIRHDDGSVTYYAHLKKWTVAVSVGQRVRCGTRLGLVGSSGYSTGPHLHFEPRTSGNGRFDPFRGSCSGGSGWWISQGSHGGRPAKRCGPQDRDGDGYDEDRDCNDSNAAIHPGAAEICDNGVDENCDGTDAASGTWFLDEDGDGWGDKAVNECGAQPAGTTDVGGDCDDSRPTVHPGAPELCDGLDNDCDAELDEGRPQELGETRPAMAARVTDLSAPAVLPRGGVGPVWLVVENVGTQTWPAGAVWLRAELGGDASPLHDEQGWAAHDVLGTLEAAVAPGGRGTLVGSVRLPDDAAGPVAQTFELTDADGVAVRCPAAPVSLQVSVAPQAPGGGVAVPLGDPGLPVGCAAGAAPVGVAWLAGLLVAGRRRC